jgi:hypothetical protein
VSDVHRILEINAEIQVDTNRPRLRGFNPLDPVSIQLALLECDSLVEDYMAKFRSRVDNPATFQAFVEVYQNEFRKEVLRLVGLVHSVVKEEGGDILDGY